MLWRLAARLLTGPAAFFVAGAIDITAFIVVAARRWLRARSGY
ncbi:MAG: hypothetical protein ACR2LV_09475 [Solirubrobacteraceae bacterium]